MIYQYPFYEDVVSVKLIAQTMPIKEAICPYNITDMQEFIAYCARVSNPSNQGNVDTSDKLLQYLLKHKHMSPFEMVDVVLEINTTRDIGRQILRHRSANFQEFSGRYSDNTKDLGFCLREFRSQDIKNRQNSLETTDEHLKQQWYYIQQNTIKLAKNHYDQMLSLGLAKEQARSILPEGNIMSRMYMKAPMRTWLHYIEIRSGIETQREHRLVAIQAANEISKVFPMILDYVKS